MGKLRAKIGLLFVTAALSGFFHSCAGLPPETVVVPAENVPVKTTPSETARIETAPSQTIPERPRPAESIMGKGMVSGEKLALFLEQYNPSVDRGFIQALAFFYIDEAATEGVNHDMAFAQMCLETGFLRFGGLVQPEQNNFCGLGSIGPGQPGEVFQEPRTGVRAHIQHLKAYASDEPLKKDLVDPRFKWVRRGSSPTIHGLSGTWAADKSYSEKIAAILQRLYDFSYGEKLL